MIYYKNMANSILNSNQSSALISALDSVSSAKNFAEYSYASKGVMQYSHLPAHARIVSTSQATSIGFNQNCDFPILKSGFLENAFVKMVLKNETGATAYLNANIGNLQIAEIQLISQGKVLASSKPFGRACLMSDAEYGRKKNQEKGYALQAARHTLADDGSLTFYVPLGMYFCESASQYIDTNFIEPLQVRVRLGSANQYADDGANPAVAVNLSLTSLELVQCFRMLPSDKEQEAINANYAEDDLVIVGWDLVEESTTKTPAAAVSQEFTHTITSNRCVSKLFVALEPTVDSTATDLASQAEGNYLPLSNIKLEMNGQSAIDIDADLVGYMMGVDNGSRNPNCVGNYWDSTYEHSQNVYCIDMGLLKGLDKFSGMISARELNSFKLTCTSSASSAVEASAHNLRVCMVAPQLISISSASGKVSTSLSS